MHVKAVGKYLIDPDSESPLILRGFNFTQNYWMPTDTILKTGKDDQAYKFAKRIGANSIRLTVRHSFLEPHESPLGYSAEALKWLDLQIEHAKNNGLYISLALVLPHGGDWLDKKDGNDFRLWHQLDFSTGIFSLKRWGLLINLRRKILIRIRLIKRSHHHYFQFSTLALFQG